MANIFLEEITYLTEAELKESTRLNDDGFIGDDEQIAILIRKAEIIIDSIIGIYGTKVDDTQETIFPTIENGVPKAIQKATVLLCEGMYLGGELNESKQYSGTKFIKSEQHGNDKIEFQNETTNSSGLIKKSQYITQEIEMLLKPFLTVSSGVKWSKSA